MFFPADIKHLVAIYLADANKWVYPAVFSKNEQFRFIANNSVASACFFKIITEAFVKYIFGYDSKHARLYRKTTEYFGTVE